MCGLTAAQGIFDRFGLPGPFSAGQIVPSDDPINVLVYGSSTSLGQLAAQLVHRVGETSGRSIRLIGVASSSKHEFLRGAPYKYNYLVDYRQQDWPEQVRRATGDKGVHFALDTISERDTVAKVHSTLNPQGKYHVFRSARGGGFDTANLAIQPIYGAVWEGLGVGIGYGHGKHSQKTRLCFGLLMLKSEVQAFSSPQSPRLESLLQSSLISLILAQRRMTLSCIRTRFEGCLVDWSELFPTALRC